MRFQSTSEGDREGSVTFLSQLAQPARLERNQPETVGRNGS